MTRLPADIAERIAKALDARPVRARPLAGGCIAEVLRIDLDDARRVVAKIAAKGGLAIEATMLAYLAARSPLPVPEVLLDDDDLLVMSDLGGGGRLDAEAQAEAAGHIANLHDVTSTRFGLAKDTVIGPLHQPNTPNDSWIAFLRDQRLLPMAKLAHDRGGLSPRGLMQVKGLCNKLPQLIPEPPAAALLHGDLWAGNIVVGAEGRIAGFIDPAIYYGDAEMDLAFATLFGSLGKPFFERYDRLVGLRPGFFETRRDIYNLYPLLVHAALFGAGYGRQAETVLERFV